jgi:alpha-beta hydrolase superfamily lysophospholipase
MSAKFRYSESMSRQEARVRSFDGTEIYYQMWRAPNPRGLIVVTHGFAEHSDCYARIIERWALKDWNVVAWDLRGHGQSEGQRGYVEAFADYPKDFQQVLAALNQRSPLQNQPLVLFGHSMGGLVTYSMALQYTHWPISGVVLSAPLFDIALSVPAWKDKLSGVLSKYVPRLTLGAEINFDVLTRDKSLIPSYEADSLRHEKISPRLYVEMQNQGLWAQQQAHNWILPVFFQLAGDDKVVSTPAALKIFDNLTSPVKQQKVYPNRFHEIYNDLGHEEVDTDLKEFLDSIHGGNR